MLGPEAVVPETALGYASGAAARYVGHEEEWTGEPPARNHATKGAWKLENGPFLM